MKKILVLVGAALLLLSPHFSFAATNKTWVGIVSYINGSNIYFKTGSGASFSAEISGASLVRKNGTPITLTDFWVGDKIEVKGSPWHDNSISATSVRDLTLYTHTGSFSGKIIEISPQNLSFKVQSTQPAVRTITTNYLTGIKKNGSAAVFNNLELGMSVKIKGSWERTESPILATLVDAKLRLINITIEGIVIMKQPGSLTVISDNTLYGVDTSKISSTLPQVSQKVKVSGKHVSGSVKIEATSVKIIKPK